MQPRRAHRGTVFQLAIGLVLLFLSLPAVSHGQITLDGSMGPAGALSGPNYTISSNLGQIRGGNLFHSFGLFNVLTNQSATFTGPNTISNIFGRVTGGQPSTVDGRISSTIPGANLYLMNPAGVLFGPNAWLDVQGSFHVTTADYLKFADGAMFHADLAKQSVLTTAPVSAFGFLSQNPAGISVQGSTLQVPDGETLSVIGGNIDVVGDPFFTSQGYPTLSAYGGKLQLASVASPGEVPLNVQNLNLAAFDRLGQINLSNAAYLDVSNYFGGAVGTVVIRGGRLLVDSSLIFADNYSNLDGAGKGIDVQVKEDAVVTNDSFITTDFFGAGNAGKIQFTAGALEVSNFALIASSGSFGSTGNGGKIEIRTADINITNSGEILTSTNGPGTGGAIDLRAENNLIMSGGATIRSDTIGSGLAGQSGDITISAKNLLMTNDAELGTSTLGTGRAGNVAVNVGRLSLTGGARIINSTEGSGQGGAMMITATDSTLIAGASGFGSSAILTPASGNGDAGQITLRTPTLTITDGAGISAQTRFGDGNAGDVTVYADRLVLTTGGQIGSATQGSGNGGQVTVNATEAVIMDGRDNNGFRSGLFANTSGSGAGGRVTVNAPGASVTLGNGASLSTLSTDTGRAGNIVVATDRLNLSGESFIQSSTVGDGLGGTVNVSAATALSLSNSEILTESFGTKAGGDIQIAANQIYLGDNALISASSFGSGNAGNINMAAQVFRSANSSVETQASTADGGNIHLTVGKLVDLFNSQITTSVQSGFGSGGNITIDPTFVTLNHSQITANAFGGPGGNINITADVFLASPDSSVTASSALSTPGTVDVQAAITNISGLLEPLPENIFQATSLLQQSCAARFSTGKLSSLVVGGRDGLPLEPGGFMPSPLYRLDAQKSAVGDQKSEVRGQRSEVVGQRSEFQHVTASAKLKFSLNGPCVK